MRQPRTMQVLWALALAWVVACLLVASLADAWFQAGPRFETRNAPLVIEGRNLAEAVQDDGQRFRLLGDGVRLYANLDVTFRIDSGGNAAATTPFTVVARGKPLDDIWPLLTLEVDRKNVGGFYVTSTDWGLYRIDLPLSPGEHHFRLSFANDASRFPRDRDVDLQSIRLGEVSSETDALARWQVPGTIPARRMAEQIFAEPSMAGLTMWGGGSAADHVLFADGGPTTVAILASARDGEGSVALAVDGSRMTGFDIVAGPPQRLLATVDVAAGWHRVELSRPGQQRDAPPVEIHEIVIGAPAPSGSPDHGPLQLTGTSRSVEPNEFDVDSGSSTDDGEKVLWSNGFVGRTVTVAHSGTWRLELSARGEMCHGVGPRVLVLSGVDQVAELQVDSENTAVYAVGLPLTPGTHEILFVYVNDAAIPQVCDRNLRVSGLRFAPNASM